MRYLARHLALAALMLWLAAGVAAQSAVTASATSPEEAEEKKEVEDTLGWHIVEEGESLQAITRHYLGTSLLWMDNWRLNPQIRNPHLLQPGQRLRVIVERQIPARAAVVGEVANEVDKNPQRRGWLDATDGDVLAPRDGLRTLQRSSARLDFDDGTKLTLSEYSQVFLKDISTSLTGVRRGAIEIERGQADLAIRTPRPKRSDIELVIGDAVARPQADASGKAATRMRRPVEGGSQLMVYGGTSQLEAGGQSVAVAQGMGSQVPAGGVPSPPEKLLPRPRPLQPGAESRWAYANPAFSWQPVDGAVSYTVEVCRDTECGALVARMSGLTATRWQGEPLPAADLFWRVTAVSGSALDGYPSRSVPFTITDGRVDREPPVVVAAVIGPGVIAEAGPITLGPGAALRLIAVDDASGVADLRYRWNGGPWQRWNERDLAPPAGADKAQLEVEGTDVLGQVSETWSVEVVRDETPPAAAQAERRVKRQ